jgi:Mg-chelatase subunit ChlD
MNLALHGLAFVATATLATATLGCSGPEVAARASGGSSGSAAASGGRGGSGGHAGSPGAPDGGPSLAGVSGSSGTGDAGQADQAPSEQMNCGLNKIQLGRKTGNLLLVLDRSGSMGLPIGGGQPAERWGEVVGALDAVVGQTQQSINWGLKLFPDGSVCGVPDGVNVAMVGMNHDPIMTAINQNRPVIDGGATPTQDAVRKALAFLKSRPDMKDPTLVIATDGEPNCTAGVEPGEGSDADGAVAAVAEAAAAGVPAYVVGIATAGSQADDTLNRMADAGGRARADATHYYPVASRDQLMQAFKTITGEIASCVFPLNPKPPVPENVAVDLDGARLPQDQSMAQGWHYGPAGDSIELAGAACEKVKSAPASNVQIIYGCPNVVIP